MIETFEMLMKSCEKFDLLFVQKSELKTAVSQELYQLFQ